jgi:hypothetical protein
VLHSQSLPFGTDDRAATPSRVTNGEGSADTLPSLLVSVGARYLRAYWNVKLVLSFSVTV